MAEPERCTPAPTETVWSTFTVDIPVESVITSILDAPEPIVTEIVVTSRSCPFGDNPIGCSDVVEIRTTLAAEESGLEAVSTATSMSAQTTSIAVSTLYTPCPTRGPQQEDDKNDEESEQTRDQSPEAEPSKTDEDEQEIPEGEESNPASEAMSTSISESPTPTSIESPSIETVLVIDSQTILSTTAVAPPASSTSTSTQSSVSSEETPTEINQTTPVSTSTSIARDTAFLPDQTVSASLPADNSQVRADTAAVNPDEAGKRVGAIIGSVAGAFIGILLLLLLARFLYRRFARNKELEDLDIFLTKNHQSRSSLDEGDIDDRPRSMEERSGQDSGPARSYGHRRENSISKEDTTFVMERPSSAYGNARPISTYSVHPPATSAPYTDSTWVPADQVLAGRANSRSSRPGSSFSHSRKSSYNSLYSINELPNMAGLGAHHSFVPPAPLRPSNVRFEGSSVASHVESLPMPSYAQEPELYSPVDQQVGISRLRVMNDEGT